MMVSIPSKKPCFLSVALELVSCVTDDQDSQTQKGDIYIYGGCRANSAAHA